LDGCEKKGVAGKGFVRLLKQRPASVGRGDKNRTAAKTLWAGGKEEKDQKRDTGSKTLVYITASVTICQVRNKDCESNGLPASLRSKPKRNPKIG
jgi:hypothetical protein